MRKGLAAGRTMAFRHSFGLAAGNRCHNALASPVGKPDREIDTGYLIAQCPPTVNREHQFSKLRTAARACRGTLSA